MIKMTEEAFSTFLYFTDTSYDYGLITRKEYIARLINIFRINGMDIHEYYNIKEKDDEKREYENNEIDEEITTEIESDTSQIVKLSTEFYAIDNVLYFSTIKKGKYCKWRFHETDADDKPSIPHGHGIEKADYKLDPYTSKIYDIKKGFDKEISKEDDEFIVYLWNNEDFRRLATLNIKHHINNLNKHSLYWTNYRGLTHSPYKLPKRRKR